MAKSDALPEAIGSIDELNSLIGMCRSSVNSNHEFLNYELMARSSRKQVQNELVKIQNNLFIIGSQLAGSKKRIVNYEVRRLEKLIDKLTDQLPKLSNFIYPVGELQLARTVCRRAERRVVDYVNSKSEILNPKQFQNVLKYLNRLSDALFTMARWVNYKLKIAEEVWK